MVTICGDTKVLKPVFAQCQVLSVLVSDNRLQFDSMELATFSRTWSLSLAHSYLAINSQSSSKVQKTVKTLKQLFTSATSRVSQITSLSLTGATH